MDKPEFVETIRAAYQRVADLIETLPDERLQEPVMGDWTGKDLIAHMAWWHDHSALVIESLRAGREPYDRSDPEFSVDPLNERTYREHRNDPPAVTKQAFNDSFGRLQVALEPVTDDELFAGGHWAWLGGEALAEPILWDTTRHYDDHRQLLEQLSGRPPAE